MDIASLPDIVVATIAVLGAGGSAFGWLAGRKVRRLNEEKTDLQVQNTRLELAARSDEERDRLARRQAKDVTVRLRDTSAYVHNASTAPIFDVTVTALGKNANDRVGVTTGRIKAGEEYCVWFPDEWENPAFDLRFKDADGRYWRLDEYEKLDLDADPPRVGSKSAPPRA